ncbi:MAG: serine hydrolase [Pyrinomonadaceae bacterium]|nr:serine hydrolase [Pyrinomonadaceae bacterium]
MKIKQINRVVRSLVFVLCVASAVWAQDPLITEIDLFVTGEMMRQRTPGISIAVVKDGKPMLVKGYGFANIEHQILVKPETIFQSGSVGKQFTAMAVMMLVEEGKVALDEKLAKYIPDVPATWSGITVRHLLTHTSGLGDYPQDFDLQRDGSEQEIFKKLQAGSLASQPGERWAYSNVGYMTLGVLIRKVSGQFYGDFLAQRVFKPLGMTTARIISEADIVHNRAAGYELVKGEIKNQTWVAPSLNTTADGALYLTVLDMIKWDEALMAGKLLKKESYEQMWSPVKLNNGNTHPYGFGWALGNVNGKKLIEHGGAWQGFKAHIARYPDNKLTVIVLANLAQTNQSRIAHGIAEVVQPDLKPKPIADPDPAFTLQTKALLEAVIAGKADLTKFTPEVQGPLKNSDQLASFIKNLGPLKSFTFTDKAEGQLGGIRYRYKVEYTEMTLSLVMLVDKQGKIAGFGLQPE